MTSAVPIPRAKRVRNMVFLLSRFASVANLTGGASRSTAREW
jgi:hypothetical protein